MVLIEIPRFIMIKFPSDAATLCTVARCKIVLFLGFGKSSYYSLHIMVYHGLPIMVNQFGWWVSTLMASLTMKYPLFYTFSKSTCQNC